MWCKSHRNLVDSLYLPWNLWLDELSTSQKPHWVSFMCLLTGVELLTFCSHRKLGSSISTALGVGPLRCHLGFSREKTPLTNDPSAWSVGLLQLKGRCVGHSTLHGIQQLGAITAALARDQHEEVPWPALVSTPQMWDPENIIFWGKIYIFLWEYFWCHRWDSNRQESLHLFQFSPAGTLIQAEEQISVSPWGWQINWSPLQSLYENFGPDPTWGIFFLLYSPCSEQLLRLYCKWPVWI